MTIITYVWGVDLYYNEAQRFRRDLEAQGHRVILHTPHILEHLDLAIQKPLLIKWCLQVYEEPVLWLDVDMLIEADIPTPPESPALVDYKKAGANYPYSAGFVYVSPKDIDFVNHWIEVLATKACAWGDHNAMLVALQGVKVHKLPMHYQSPTEPCITRIVDCGARYGGRYTQVQRVRKHIEYRKPPCMPVEGFEYFPQKLCINLARRPQRWRQTESEFEKIKHKVTRHDATDMPGNPIRGSALSHNKCWRKLDSRMLIVEDDVVFHEDADNLMRLCVRELLWYAPDWDIFALGYNPEWMCDCEHFTSHLRRMRSFVSIHAYAIQATPRIMQLRREMNQHTKQENPLVLDRWLATKMSQLRVYGACPQIAYQRSGYSDLEGREVDRKVWR